MNTDYLPHDDNDIISHCYVPLSKPTITFRETNFIDIIRRKDRYTRKRITYITDENHPLLRKYIPNGKKSTFESLCTTTHDNIQKFIREDTSINDAIFCDTYILCGETIDFYVYVPVKKCKIFDTTYVIST